jgi:hypothetical protein
MPREVHVVPHTHWDREWYAPFQEFRLKLVDLVDDLVAGLEDGSAGPHFLLDGQMAAVDDYLELRPEMAARLAALVASGRLAVGPWYVLPDEFLVSGETLVRDLQLGLRRGADFGGAMAVGYLPDMFGHVAQMPQLLRLAELDVAVVWRGVPSSVTRTSFRWRAPDGSSVRAAYLPEGYGNGAFVPEDPAALVAEVDEFVAVRPSMIEGAVLWMNGTDHQLPTPHLVETLERANRSQSAYVFSIVSLAEHLATLPTGDLPVHDGEMRSGARANLLMGVTSNRVDVRAAAAGAETALERVAEPMCALFSDAARWPAAALDLAWREVIRNAAHDSVCACSHDEVVRTVLHRYAEARHIAETLVERSLYWFGCEMQTRGTVICNTAQRERRAIAETDRGPVSVTVPAFGWTVVPDDLVPPSAEPPVVVTGDALDNGLVRVVVDGRAGTFSIGGHHGLGRLADGGDRGDTYNWCPPEHDQLIREPVDVAVRILDHDHARGRVAIDRTYRIPSRIVDEKRVDPVDGLVRTTIELRACEAFVRCTIDVDNVWSDHRLRLELPLPAPADRSHASCAFTAVERGLVAEGGPTEVGLPTFPASRFVRAGDLTVAFDAVTEYELTDIGAAGASTLALTVLRATGMLSQGPMPTRPLPAGPELPLRDAQLPTHVTRRFAMAIGAVDPYALTDAFVPFPTVHAPGGGPIRDHGSFLSVGGAEVTAVQRVGDDLVVRAFNTAATTSTLTVDGRRGHVVDLRGEPVAMFDGTLELRPHQIVTLRLSGS